MILLIHNNISEPIHYCHEPIIEICYGVCGGPIYTDLKYKEQDGIYTYGTIVIDTIFNVAEWYDCFQTTCYLLPEEIGTKRHLRLS